MLYSSQRKPIKDMQKLKGNFHHLLKLASLRTYCVKLSEHRVGLPSWCRPELFRKHVPGKKVLVVTNENIAKLYLDK